MRASDVTDVLGLVVLVAFALVLTRPGSQGPALVSSFFSGFAGSLQVATGGPGPFKQPTGRK